MHHHHVHLPGAGGGIFEQKSEDSQANDPHDLLEAFFQTSKGPARKIIRQDHHDRDDELDKEQTKQANNTDATVKSSAPSKITSIEIPNKEDNAHGDEDASVPSLLSSPEVDDVWEQIEDEEEEDSVKNHFEDERRSKSVSRQLSIDQKWKEIKEEYEFRDKVLRRISNGKKSALIDLLKRHEREAKASETERLLLRILYGSEQSSLDTRSFDQVSTDEKEEQTQLQRDSAPAKITKSEHTEQGGPSEKSKKSATSVSKENKSKQKDVDTLNPSFSARPDKTKPKLVQSLGSQLYDMLVFELCATIPAILSLIVHCTAHLGIYSVIDCIVDRIRLRFHSEDSTTAQNRVYLVMLALGLLLLRFSGYLYWWLNEQDYSCVKFEFHSRLRLGKWDARSLKWISERGILRSVVYTVGYYLVYMNVEELHYHLSRFFDDRESILEGLPSRAFDAGSCMNEDTLVDNNKMFSFSCEAEIERRDEQYEELVGADALYLWGKLSSDSYSSYWSEVGELYDGDVVWPLLSNTQELLFYATTAVLSVSLLLMYGFPFFEKY